MPNFKPYNHDQSAMIVINFQDQLQSDTFEYTLHHLINDRLDLSVFYPSYNNDSGGRTAYGPAILLRIILFAYSKGITSSREIQWNCENNIIFKALSCDSVPHWTTIASFVSGFSEEIEELFEQVILICDQQGLLGKELFAIDGCKLSSNTSKEWSGTHKELNQKKDKIHRQIQYWINEHTQADTSGIDTRKARTEQTLKTLNQAYERIDQFLKTSAPREGKGRRKTEVKSNITDNESAKMTTSKGTIQGYNGIAIVDKKHQVIVSAQTFGEGQEHHRLKPVLEAVKDRLKRLDIDRDIYQSGAIVTADTGFANEANIKHLYEEKINGYIPDNRFRSRDPTFTKQKAHHGSRRRQDVKRPGFQVIPASEFEFDPTELSCRCPQGETISFRGIREDYQGNKRAMLEGRLSQCKGCPIKSRCMKNPESANHRKGNGRQVSFPIGAKKPTYTDWMKHRVDSPKGKEVYSHRMSVVDR